jgi:hypothetical protein
MSRVFERGVAGGTAVVRGPAGKGLSDDYAILGVVTL